MSPTGNFSSVLNDVAHQVEHILGAEFKARGFDPKLAELYSQALVGMVALTGRWWLEVRKPRKEVVAAHLVNLAWNGLSNLEAKPGLVSRKAAESGEPVSVGVVLGRARRGAPVLPLVVVRVVAVVQAEVLLVAPRPRRRRPARTARRSAAGCR